MRIHLGLPGPRHSDLPDKRLGCSRLPEEMGKVHGAAAIVLRLITAFN